MNDFWYFGCESESEIGHFLFTQFGSGRQHNDDPRMGFPMHLLDGTFAPVTKVPDTWRRVVIHAGHELLTIIAGWDNTADTRPGSNAAFIANGVKSIEEMLVRAAQIFPEQHKRIFGRATVVTWVPE